jgi:outer membrane lipoprotein-sorting protein
MSGRNDSILSHNQHFPNMKHKPHNFTFRKTLCFAAVSAVTALWIDLSGSLVAQDAAAAPEAQPAGVSGSVVTELDALETLKEVRDRLESLQFLQCSLHERVDLSDLRFYARGRYAQASGNRVRLEFQMFPIRGVRRDDEATLKLDGTPEDTGKQKPTGELVQVSDGNALWSYWKNGDSQRLTRRNIQEILEAADQAENFDRSRMFEDLGAGGLQALLARLETGMEFGKVREQTVGDTRLLVISGRWTKESLQQYFQITDPAAPRPAWVPDYVRVYVDAEAKLPRRIQYLKKHPNPAAKQVRPLITLDFRDMTINDTVDDSQFQFEAPAGLAELDLTEQTIDAIRKTNTAEKTAAASADIPTTEPAVDAAPANAE